MTSRHGAGNGQKTKYNSHYETLRLNSRCRGIFIIMLTYYIYFLPVPTAVPVRVFHPLHPVHRFHGGAPLNPRPPKPLRGSPPVPSTARGVVGASTAAGVRPPPSSSVVLPRLQAQSQQGARLRFAPLWSLLGLLFSCCSRFVRPPPRFRPPSSRLTHPRLPLPCPVSIRSSVPTDRPPFNWGRFRSDRLFHAARLIKIHKKT